MKQLKLIAVVAILGIAAHFSTVSSPSVLRFDPVNTTYSGSYAEYKFCEGCNEDLNEEEKKDEAEEAIWLNTTY